MIFIGGIGQGSKTLQYTGTLKCKFCGSMAGCQILMSYHYFSFFFIPLFKWNKRFLVKMACCGAVYELDPQVGKAIVRGEGMDILDQDLRLVADGRPVYRAYGAYGGAQGNGQEGEGGQAPDPAQKLRCPVCKYEAPGDPNYCPKCGQRLR